jgi:hypothetical protein
MRERSRSDFLSPDIFVFLLHLLSVASHIYRSRDHENDDTDPLRSPTTSAIAAATEVVVVVVVE